VTTICGTHVLAVRGGAASTAGTGVEVAHVHGLGVDPADGTLYAGTHHGLIRAPRPAPVLPTGRGAFRRGLQRQEDHGLRQDDR
jgi:hypothetical protein